jgi:DNA-directed RNA polymerase, mitochondrial
MQNIRDLLRRQLELEDESRALGADRYHARKLPWKVDAGTVDEEANLPPGRLLIKTCVAPVTEAINGFLADACNGKAGRRHNAADYLLLMEADEAAYLAVRVMVNMAISQSAFQTIAIRIADALIENLEFKAFREQNRKGYKGYLKAQEQRGYSRQRKAAVKKLFVAEGVRREVPETVKATIGLKLMELVMEATGLFSKDAQKHKRGYTYRLKPTETLQKWLDNQHDRCSSMEPINLPMLVRPRRWRSPTYGGYLTPRTGNRFIKQRNHAYHEELRGIDIDACYAAVNHIQDTPWRINTDVLDVMQTVWSEGTSLGGLPQRSDDPVPAKPFDIDTNEEAKAEWKREAARVYAKNAERISSRMALMQGLWVARRFADEDRIYFPHELDFRGRVYPIPVFGPSPQGSDWQKALIHFADAKPLGLQGFRWLQIHIANLFGVDKVSFDDRLAWVCGHIDLLLDSGASPLDGQRFWTTADSPYGALAACMELHRAMSLEDPTAYESRIPVALDGSCSGLQHFSAMLRDEAGGRTVNLLPSETPADVYMAVATVAQAEADATPTITYTVVVDGEEQELTVPNPWRGGKVNRKIAKRPTMTYCYSATRFGMQQMIHQTLRELDREAEMAGAGPHLGGADNYHAAMWLSHALYRAIRSTIKSAAAAMDWLRDAAQVAAKADLPLWWETPMGLPILQEYKKQKGKAIDTHWAGARLQILVQVDEEKIDSRAQANGVAPNFVHSLDAAHLQGVALQARSEGLAHLAMIHDSFGAHAADTDRLSAILRETFIKQYEGDVLGDFYEQLKEQLGEELAAELPAPPKAGSLDLSDVLSAAYTFA